MGILEEFLETKALVKEAENTFELSGSISKSYRQLVFEPRSGIRERALKLALERVGRPQFAKALELQPDPALSPELQRLNAQRLALRQSAGRRLTNQLALVRQQDEAADTEEREFARLSPLQQSKTRDGWYRRSTLDRNAAILGLLQRERRNSSPLTREAWSRAKAIAASRGMTSPYVVVNSDVASAVDVLTDPCVEYRLIAERRRQTFFAKGLIVAGGYPGHRRRSRSPC